MAAIKAKRNKRMKILWCRARLIRPPSYGSVDCWLKLIEMYQRPKPKSSLHCAILSQIHLKGLMKGTPNSVEIWFGREFDGGFQPPHSF
jgi:hypothetical protein